MTAVEKLTAMVAQYNWGSRVSTECKFDECLANQSQELAGARITVLLHLKKQPHHKSAAKWEVAAH